MTKKEKEIIRRNVKRSWIELVKMEKANGYSHKRTQNARVKWDTLDDLWCELFPDEDYEEE